VEKWNSGAIKEIYTLSAIAKYDNPSTDIYVVAVDSVRGDSTFVSNEDVKAVIIDELFSDAYRIGVYNDWYDVDMGDFGSSEMYGRGEEFERCAE
jgi:hypothetical protein